MNISRELRYISIFNNQKRAQEVNVNLQKVLIQIAEEEKVWEKIVESIELISK